MKILRNIGVTILCLIIFAGPFSCWLAFTAFTIWQWPIDFASWNPFNRFLWAGVSVLILFVSLIGSMICSGELLE